MPLYRRGLLRPLLLSTMIGPLVSKPARARSLIFMLRFEWDSAALNPKTQEIIALAMTHVGTPSPFGAVQTIQVNAHADRSGAEPYNMDLSLRRAEAVTAQLLGLGMPRRDLRVTAYGESRPLVATPDGVREAENRRVELVLY